MLKMIILSALCLFMFAHYNNLAIAQSTFIGEIEDFRHPFSITTIKGKKVEPKLGYMILPGDEFVTGKLGWVKYELADEGSFKLGQNSQITINEPIVAEEDSKKTDIQLVIGELLSKLKKIRKGPFVLWTPSIVTGVRGTEFQTIVAIDATTLFVVDDGDIEIEAEGKKVTVPKGKMIKVEYDEEPSSLENAVPKSERNWGQWRKKQQGIFLNRLPMITEKINAGFSKQLDGIRIFYDDLNRQATSINEEIENLKTFKSKNRSNDAAIAANKIEFMMQGIKDKFSAFRNRLNRVRVMRKMTLRMEGFFKENIDKVAKMDLPVIHATFLQISDKRSQIVRLEKKSLGVLRDIYSKMNEIEDDLNEFRSQKGTFKRKEFKTGGKGGRRNP